MRRIISTSSAILVIGWLSPSYAADTAAVNLAVARGVAFLNSQVSGSPGGGGGKRTLIALALLKGGLDPSSPVIQETVKEILGRFQGGRYRPGGEHIYEAGVEATLLADLDPERFRDELIQLRDYIISAQLDNGAWDYPAGRDKAPHVGDTSVTQYACLGLWAITRAEIEVDPNVWLKVLNWHTRYQNNDGGFAYCPQVAIGAFRSDSTLNMTVAAVGNIHIAMLHLNPTFLPLEQELQRARIEETPKEKPKFGVLEQVVADNPTPQRRPVSIPRESVDSVRRAFNWAGNRFRVENKPSPHNTYYYYTLERMGALAGVDKLGGHDWFHECADYLLQNQKDDGSWDESSYFDKVYDTAFVVLFLTRSTGKLIKRRTAEPRIGDGTLAGGRGLPDDLSDVDFNGRQVKGKEGPKEPLDKLLASLMNTGEINIADVQDQIVEQVQLGDRSELIGQIDRIIKLVDHPDANIRQTVMWAIGRTDNMQLARHLIDGLSDQDLGVMIEAQNALCWISRKPLGFGLPRDPVEELPPNATAQQRRDAITDWHKKAVLAWGQWYLQNRPFQERGDEFESILRAKIDRLKEGVVLR